VRALLDLMRDNEAAVKDVSGLDLLHNASARLKILDPEHGEEELIGLVAAELAKFSLPQRKPSTINPRPTTLNPKP